MIVSETVDVFKDYFQTFSCPKKSWGKGKGVRVAVIDSGIDDNCLKPKYGKQIKLSKDFTSDSSQNIITQKKGAAKLHGTLCAAIILSAAPSCELVDCCVTNSDRLDGSALSEAITWAVKEANAEILNISVGTTRLEFSSEIREACIMARKAGVIALASCSNSGTPSLPSALSEVLSVESMDLGKEGRWCCSVSQDNKIIGHSGPYLPDTLNGKCELQSMLGNSAATASMSGQVARLLSSKMKRKNSIYDMLRESAAAMI